MRANVFAEDFQYWVMDVSTNFSPLAPTDDPRKFLAVSSGLIVVTTGTDMGAVDVEVEFHDSPPQALPGGWEEVFETQGEAPSGQVIVCQHAGVPVEGLSAVDVGTTFGIRVHRNGRAEAEEAGVVVGEPIEHHYVQLWSIASTEGY